MVHRYRIPERFKQTVSNETSESESISFKSDATLLTVKVVAEGIVHIHHQVDARVELESRMGPHGMSPLAYRHKSEALVPSVSKSNDDLSMTVGSAQVVIQATSNDLTISHYRIGQTTPFLSDLPFRAYEYQLPHGVCHYSIHQPNHFIYGLGERASPLNLNGRHIRFQCVDALGYDASKTDPLYKHFPFYIGLDPKTKHAYGVYYATHSNGSLDLGSEIDAFWGPFVAYRQNWGPLNMFVFYGPTIKDVVKQFSYIVGKSAPVPKYALGYLASSMGYAESENAQAMLEDFPEKCRQYGIPCDIMHLSSGYTVDPVTGARNVFTWNDKRFPDPKSMFARLRKAGIRVVANVKPWLLSGHPHHARVVEQQGFVSDPDRSGPSITRLWSAGAGSTSTGSYFDFSHPSGKQYWKEQIKQLLKLGVEGIWNDNNEYALHDDEHTFDMNGKPCPAGLGGRALQTAKMASASYEAMIETFPNKRPFLITRSSTPGAHRYAGQTWSGDNYSSWKTLEHNIPMGLNAGLSLMFGYGHDVGGFVGPRPEPELLVRWIQNGIFHPRFCIHSWKEEGVTEPWMYPDMIPIIRDAIHFRYQLLPYLYDLSLKSSVFSEPVIRPLVYEFQDDEETYDKSFEFMLGPQLLVASLFEKNARERRVYLPKGKQWCDYWTGEWYDGGSHVTVRVPLEQHGALFAKAGTMLPMGNVMSFVSSEQDDFRTVLCFPPPCQNADELVYEANVWDDDGETLDAPLIKIKLQMTCSSDMKLRVSCQVLERAFTPAYKFLRFTLPVSSRFNFVGDEVGVDENGKKFKDIYL